MAIEDHLIEGVNGIFYITIATLFCTSISLLIRYSYKQGVQKLNVVVLL